MALTLVGRVLRGRRLVDGAVAVDGETLAERPARRGRRALPAGWAVAPGLVDLQVTGFAGAEVGDDPDAIEAVARALPAAGVTAFCPTLVSRSERAYGAPRPRSPAPARPPSGRAVSACTWRGPSSRPRARAPTARRRFATPIRPSSTGWRASSPRRSSPWRPSARGPWTPSAGSPAGACSWRWATRRRTPPSGGRRSRPARAS